MPIFFSFKCVYKIKCLYCDASYVEQTRRLLKNRIEYKNHIRRNTTQISVITEHRLKHSHEFDWNNKVILDEEIHFNKKLISEMIHIKKQFKGLNLQKKKKKKQSFLVQFIRMLLVVLWVPQLPSRIGFLPHSVQHSYIIDIQQDT